MTKAFHVFISWYVTVYIRMLQYVCEIVCVCVFVRWISPWRRLSPDWSRRAGQKVSGEPEKLRQRWRWWWDCVDMRQKTLIMTAVVVMVVLVKGVECECRSRIYIPFPISTYVKEEKKQSYLFADLCSLISSFQLHPVCKHLNWALGPLKGSLCGWLTRVNCGETLASDWGAGAEL